MIPRRVVRHPNQCERITSFKEMDVIRPDGSIQPGRTFETWQAPGRGWLWLGRMWFWRNES